MSLAQVRDVFVEAVKVYDATEDVQTIKAIARAHADAQRKWQNEHASLEEIIRGLSERESEAERACSESAANDARTHATALQQLDTQRFATARACAGLEDDSSALEAKVQALKSEIAQLGEQKARVEQDTLVEMPNIRHAISLYAKISNIKWHYDEDVFVSGYVSKGGDEASVKSFKLNPQKQSNYFITNYLWDMI